jgi:hypothetical protein
LEKLKKMMTGKSAILSPFHCFIHLYEDILSAARSQDILRMFVGLLCGWWIYVPVHELMHADGIDPLRKSGIQTLEDRFLQLIEKENQC